VDRLDWVKGAVFYQIFPDRFYNGDNTNDPLDSAEWGQKPTRKNFFGGDLEGIRQKLDYIQSLGANVIYLNPVFDAPSNHKYDTKDYFHVDPHFGGDQALHDLIEAVHDRDMKLILDGVFNHCGEEFFAFQDVLKNEMVSEYHNWFFVNHFPLSKKPLSYMCCGDASYLPKLNHENEAVNQYFLDVGRYWLEAFDVDGWRLDVPFKVSKTFWRSFRKAVKNQKQGAFLLGENWRNGDIWLDGETFDSVTNYPLRELIFDFSLTHFLDGEDYLFATRTLRNSFGSEANKVVNLLGSHDTARLMTKFDGNMPVVMLAWILLLTEVGIPLIYYGDEIGMEGKNDPGCRRTMIWDTDRWCHELYDLIRSIIKLRKQTEALTRGTFEDLYAFIGLIAYKRQYHDQEVIVILNSQDKLNYINVPVKSERTFYYLFPTNQKVWVKDGNLSFETFPKYGYQILTSFLFE
jgi:glycosidase